ncbi:hypothetical protein U1Q18_013980, partial [Sarracenia purpurea var. burkii]
GKVGGLLVLVLGVCLCLGGLLLFGDPWCMGLQSVVVVSSGGMLVQWDVGAVERDVVALWCRAGHSKTHCFEVVVDQFFEGDSLAPSIVLAWVRRPSCSREVVLGLGYQYGHFFRQVEYAVIEIFAVMESFVVSMRSLLPGDLLLAGSFLQSYGAVVLVWGLQ